jgi:hypothetical protein
VAPADRPPLDSALKTPPSRRRALQRRRERPRLVQTWRLEDPETARLRLPGPFRPRHPVPLRPYLGCSRARGDPAALPGPFSGARPVPAALPGPFSGARPVPSAVPGPFAGAWRPPGAVPRRFAGAWRPWATLPGDLGPVRAPQTKTDNALHSGGRGYVQRARAPDAGPAPVGRPTTPWDRRIREALAPAAPRMKEV